MEPIWLEPGTSGFACHVLDMSAMAAAMRSASTDPRIATTYLAMRNSNGSDLRALLPHQPLRARCDLRYPLAHELIDGPLFKASSMEEKWDIYLWDRALYLTRSWTGTLVFVAEVTATPAELRIHQIHADREASHGSAYLARRQVDFIVRSHYYDQVIPHPLPDSIPDDIDAITSYSFRVFGNRARYATYADTACIGRDELRPAGSPAEGHG